MGWLGDSLLQSVSLEGLTFRSQVHLHQENTPCLNYQSFPDKRETEKLKVKVKEAVEGSGKAAAVQIGYSQWGLLGCSPLKVLQSFNLSHIQSLR